jgi:uncharacterized protein (DUF433 family)
MTRIHWQDHIVVAPDIHHGEPCIKGARIPVAIILGSLADGMQAEDIVDAYPHLTVDDIHATLAYVDDAPSNDHGS